MRTTIAIFCLWVTSTFALFGQTLTSMSPTTALAGGPSFLLTVNGTGFGPLMPITWDGTNLTTTLVSATQMTATIASSLLTPGAHLVRVRTALFPPQSTLPLTFTVNNPAPTLTSMNPPNRTVNSVGFGLSVTGTNFLSGASLTFNGTPVTTTVISATALNASIPTSLITSAAVVPVVVTNPPPGGGPSNTLSFTIINPVPVLSILTPSFAPTGSPAVTITLTGSGFHSGSLVRANGNNLTTTFVSGTSLTAVIPSSVLASTGQKTIAIFNPPPSGGTSNAFSFAVNPVVPTLVAVQPSLFVNVGGNGQTTLTGTGFSPESIVEIGSPFSAVSSTFVSSTSLLATIPQLALTNTPVPLRVRNPFVGGGSSASINILVVPAQPSLSALSPSSVTAGSGNLSLSLSGSGYHASCRVIIGSGPNLIPVVTSPTLMSVTVPAAQLANAGVLPVTVVNTLIGGGNSQVLSLAVNGIAPTLTSFTQQGSPLLSNQGGTLTVFGSGFLPNAIARINGTQFTISSQNATSVTVQIPTNAITTPGNRSLTVENSGPSGGVSNALSLAFINPFPSAGTLALSLPPQGTTPYTVTFNGTGYCSQSQVTLDGVPALVNAVSNASITFSFSGTRASTFRMLRTRVVNPGPGGGTSPEFFVQVGSTIVLGVLPQSIPVVAPQSAGVPFSISGLSFTAALAVRINGVLVPSTFINSNQIDAFVLPTVPGATLPGSLTVTLHQGTSYSSNGVSLGVGTNPTPLNRGVVRLSPLAPAPGGNFAVVVEVPGADNLPFTLILDTTPLPPSVVPVGGGNHLALGVGLGTPIPIIDSLALFGPPSPVLMRQIVNLSVPFSPASFMVSGFYMDDLVAPPQVIGLNVTLQAAWFDATFPGGINLTSICGPHTL